MSILTSRAFTSSLLRHVHVNYGTQDSNEAPEKKAIASIYNPDVLLYPGMDLLNHSATTANHWETDAHGFSLICNDEPKPGEEIFNCYGPRNNGQLLLLYGFILADNQHDAFPLKLSPREYPLPLEYLNLTPDMASQQEPQKISEAHDPSMTTFYIRSSPTFSSEAITPGYPRPGQDAFVIALAGMPLSLTSRLTSLLLNGRERGSILSDGFRERVQPHLQTTPLCALISVRSTLALSSLLLDRLRMEQARLAKGLTNLRNALTQLDEDAIDAETSNSDTTNTSKKRKRSQSPSSRDPSLEQPLTRNATRHETRLHHAKTYMFSQSHILSTNISRLNDAFFQGIHLTNSTSNPHSIPIKSIYTLSSAYHCLPKTPRRAFDLALKLLAVTGEDAFDPDTAMFLARGNDMEEDLWALWVGIAILGIQLKIWDPRGMVLHLFPSCSDSCLLGIISSKLACLLGMFGKRS